MRKTMREIINRHIEALKKSGRKNEAAQLSLDISVLGPRATEAQLQKAFTKSAQGMTT